MMFTQLITWGMTLALTIFLPRYLGAAAVGRLIFVSSLWAIITVIATFGMDTYMFRTIARDPARMPSLLWNSIAVRSMLFILGCIALSAFLRFFDYPEDTRQLAWIMAFNGLTWLFIGAVQSSLQGLEAMAHSSMGYIVNKVVNTSLAIILLLLGVGVEVIAVVIVISSISNLAVQFYFLRRQSALPLSFDTGEMKNLMRSSLPFLFSAVFLVGYMELDKVMISLLADEQSIGWYGSANQLFGTLLFIPSVLMTAVFPALARRSQADEHGFYRMSRTNLNLLLLLAIPMGLGLVAVAKPVVLLLFGPGFAPSGPILSVLGIVLILTYLNVFLGQTLISQDRQNAWTWVMAVCTLATVPLDLVLIPWCAETFKNAGLGGALSFVITEAGMVVCGVYLLPRGMLDRSTVVIALKSALAGLVMFPVAWLLQDQMILVPILAGAIVYFGMAWMLGILPMQYFQVYIEMARRWAARRFQGTFLAGIFSRDN